MPGHLTHAGHQMDINYLWGVVQELSDALAQNRAQTAGIIGSVQRMQARASEDGGQQPSLQQVNGEIHSNVWRVTFNCLFADGITQAIKLPS